jgi:hypothetical protein
MKHKIIIFFLIFLALPMAISAEVQDNAQSRQTEREWLKKAVNAPDDTTDKELARMCYERLEELRSFGMMGIKTPTEWLLAATSFDPDNETYRNELAELYDNYWQYMELNPNAEGLEDFEREHTKELLMIRQKIEDIIGHQQYEPMIYDNGWTKLSESELSEKMNTPVININTGKPFNFKMVKDEIVAKDFTNTPLEFYNNALDGYSLDLYTTYDIIQGGLFTGVALPLIYYQHAKPSKYSFVRGFSFADGDPLLVLPVDFVFWVGSDQREFIDLASHQEQSWRQVSPRAWIIKKSENSISLYDTFCEDFYKVDDEEQYTGELPSHILSLEVMGDFNNDGYEDIVVSYAHYLVGGSGRSYEFTVLTRTSKDDIFRDITNEVGRIIWKRSE